MGRSHVVAGVAACVAVASAGRAVLDSRAEILAPARDAVEFLISRYVVVSERPGLEFVWLAGCLILFLFGTVLPDVDSPTSTISSILGTSIPLPHRRVTHSIWVCAALFCVGLKLRCLMYLFAGYASHVFFDKFSAAGVCLLWPLTRYETFPSGAFVARGHKLKLYRAGEGSETLFVVFVWFVALALAWFAFGDHVAGLMSRG